MGLSVWAWARAASVSLAGSGGGGHRGAAPQLGPKLQTQKAADTYVLVPKRPLGGCLLAFDRSEEGSHALGRADFKPLLISKCLALAGSFGCRLGQIPELRSCGCTTTLVYKLPLLSEAFDCVRQLLLQLRVKLPTLSSCCPCGKHLQPAGLRTAPPGLNPDASEGLADHGEVGTPVLLAAEEMQFGPTREVRKIVGGRVLHQWDTRYFSKLGFHKVVRSLLYFPQPSRWGRVLWKRNLP